MTSIFILHPSNPNKRILVNTNELDVDKVIMETRKVCRGEYDSYRYDTSRNAIYIYTEDTSGSKSCIKSYRDTVTAVQELYKIGVDLDQERLASMTGCVDNDHVVNTAEE